MANCSTGDCTVSFTVLDSSQEGSPWLYPLTGTASHPTFGEVASLRGVLMTARFSWKQRGDFLSIMDDQGEELKRFSEDIFNIDFNVNYWHIDGGRWSGSGCWGRELHSGDVFYLEYLSVKEEFRGIGIGSWFLQKFLKDPGIFPKLYLSGRGHAYCWPASETETNEGNDNPLSFFHKNGFRRVGLTKFLCYSGDPDHPSRNVAISDDPEPFTNDYTDGYTPTILDPVDTNPLLYHISSVKDIGIHHILQYAYDLDDTNIHRAGPEGFTPIHWAAWTANLIAIRTLLEPGVAEDLNNTTNKWGTTPLETFTRMKRLRRQSQENGGGFWYGYSAEELICEFLLKKASNNPLSTATEEGYVAERMFGCTCGQCTNGWLSPRMRHRLSTSAILHHDMSMDDTRGLEHRSSAEDYLTFVPDLRYLPHSLQSKMSRGLCFDFIHTFLTIYNILETPRGLPDVDLISSMPANSRFISSGGKVEYAISAVLGSAREQSPLGDDYLP